MLGRSEKKNAIHFGGIMTSYLRVMAVLAFFMFLFLLLPSFAQAQPELGLEFATETGLGTEDIRTTISRIINAFLGLLGLVAVMIILYAGFTWMTAGGNEEKIAKAKKLLINGFIGIVIIMTSYALVSFLFKSILDASQGAGGTSKASPLTSLYGGGRGTGALGSGIIDYHYPEAGQVDVPRNTKISITMKKPLVLSTMIREYYDNGTYTTADDYLCADVAVPSVVPDELLADTQARLSASGCSPVLEDTPLELQIMNVKIIPNVDLGTPTDGDVDDQFDQRYPDSQTVIMSGFPSVSVTPVQTDTVDPEQGQTLIITTSDPIGSPLEDMNYRVAFRGGDTGVKVWSVDNTTNAEYMDEAFEEKAVDGSYFWGFTVGTEMDLTPPKVNGVEPGQKYWDPAEEIFRNQILQIYFDEAIDPTSASGKTGFGEGAGFTKIDVQARCPGAANSCGAIVHNDGSATVLTSSWEPLDGEVLLTNRYRTAEFTPTTPCDTVAENSCGDKVFCLPKYAEIRVIVRAASVDPSAVEDSKKPPAASAENGVTDMVGNSFDGNMTGTAEGPGVTSPAASFNGYLVNHYNLTKPPDVDLLDEGGDVKMFDDLIVEFLVGDKVDLIPPVVYGISPVSAGGTILPSDPFEGGPSKVPSEEPVVIEWSKVLRGSSLRTGPDSDETATLVMKSRELRKVNSEPCEAYADCVTEELAQLAFFYDAEKLPRGDDEYTELSLIHRPFFTGNDLGYTLEEMKDPDLDRLRPVYMPVLRSKIQDTRQNCFYPSEGYLCGTLETGPVLDPLDPPITSCCDRTGQAPFACPL
ncbi:pilin [Patescibacteria group bacterium]